jgi:phosphoribosylformimino-5-aminoimidazole carboxamide ribotide isomerase
MLIPCIDLQGGQAVQLVHGRKRELAVKDVLGLLERFRGYEWLHVIDLDAAMRKGDNNALIRELCVKARREYGMKVRVGGGIRTVRRACTIVKLGVSQIIIGSAAFRDSRPNTAFLRRLKDAVGRRRVIVALDTAKGRVVTHGWSKSLDVSPGEIAAAFEPYCGGFLGTDVDREGTMSGVNLAWFRELRRATRLPIIAAGGISSRWEIRALEKLGMDAAVGMALYKNRVR